MFDLNFKTLELQFPHHARHRDAAFKIKQELSLQGLTEHFLVFSSGTTNSDLKGYALSRKALFSNAKAVNEHFSLTSEDIWGLSIPYFHVGGLSVLARAIQLDSKLIDLGIWHPLEWSKKIHTEKVTITTVVPTQIYDLVTNQIPCPSSLKNLVVGGDYLSHELERKALLLGWPIIRTFGMTEVCSQLASAKKPTGPLEILPIHQTKLNEQRLFIKSEALFTLQFKLKESLEISYAKDFIDVDGFYPTNDLAEISNQIITPLGRLDDQLKISGKLISINSLKETLYSFALKNNCYGKVELAIESDERQGKTLIVLKLPGIPQIPEDLFFPIKFQSKAVSSFERTDLGKLKK